MKGIIFLLVALMMVTPAFAVPDEITSLGDFDVGYPYSNCYDGNLSTYCSTIQYGEGANIQLFFNFTKPEGVVGTSKLVFSVNGSNVTLDINSSCWDYSSEKLMFRWYNSDAGDSVSMIKCSPDGTFAGESYVIYSDSSYNYADNCMHEVEMDWEYEPEPEEPSSTYAVLEDVGIGLGWFLTKVGDAIYKYVLFFGFIAGVSSIVYAIAVLVSGTIRGSSK